MLTMKGRSTLINILFLCILIQWNAYRCWDVSPSFLNLWIQTGVAVSKRILSLSLSADIGPAVLLWWKPHPVISESPQGILHVAQKPLSHTVSHSDPSPRICSLGAPCDTVIGTKNSTVTIEHTAGVVSMLWVSIWKPKLSLSDISYSISSDFPIQKYFG